MKEMKVWSFYFQGHCPVGAVGLVTAEDIGVACILAEQELNSIGLPQKIEKEQLTPVITGHRRVKILLDGNY